MTNDLDRRFLLGGIAGAAGVSALAAMARGGPLNPPAGAVASTGKPLNEVEPRIAVNAVNTPSAGASVFRISQPGSYYLTGNIQGVASASGIHIAASNVTLDLCGFTLRGVAGSNDGISSGAANISGVTILNGHAAGWGASGVTFYAGARGVRIIGVTSSDNGGTGIHAELSALIAHCTAYNNTGAGFSMVQNGRLENCVSSANYHGVSVQSGCTVTQCECCGNNFDGIVAVTRNLITNNHCVSNGAADTGTNIHVQGNGNRLEGNSCIGAPRGYYAESAGNILLRNTAHANGLNWTLAAGNAGIVYSANTGGLVSGNGGGVAIGPAAYDPNANFSY